MSWLLPHRGQTELARLDVVLAENELARIRAEEAARKAAATAVADQRKLEVTLAETRRRSEERRERARQRAASNPELDAVTATIKLLGSRR